MNRGTAFITLVQTIAQSAAYDRGRCVYIAIQIAQREEDVPSVKKMYQAAHDVIAYVHGEQYGSWLADWLVENGHLPKQTFQVADPKVDERSDASYAANDDDCG